MRLIIQIPCFNEEKTLPLTLSDLPRSVPGFDDVKWLVIDDGSSDRTSEIALANGVDVVVRHPTNRGLAAAFVSGVSACLQNGADVIVNTDADNQYQASDIPALVKPILDGKAEIVVGARPIMELPDFSPLKKKLQLLGSWVVRLASGTATPDAPSGFRAISRSAAKHLVVFGKYTYTLETIIQAGQNNIAVLSVPISVNRATRPSRLMKNAPQYIQRSVSTIIRIFIIYRPFRFFMSIGSVLMLAGLSLGIRFVVLYALGLGSGHVQSLVLASILAGMGFQAAMIAFVADLIAANRRLIEEVRYNLLELMEDK